MNVMAKVLVANWKMRPRTEREAFALARASDHPQVIICPPFPFLPGVRRLLRHAALGAQDVFWGSEGAHTGEVSPAQLRALGVRYVLVGHSERRALGETDAVIAKKLRAAHDAGLVPILCVGEDKAERRAGDAKRAVLRELQVVPRGVRLIVAYEPVWAIGTGVTDRPEDTSQMASVIRHRLKNSALPVLYGGSLDAHHARAFLEQSDISGVLVGGASLNARMFHTIIRIGMQYE